MKFLLVAINYFTTWIELEPLATIMVQQMQKFVWKYIVCRDRISHTILIYNSKHIIDKFLAELYVGIHI